jgi:putative peptide zinc metalloprotease protein
MAVGSVFSSHWYRIAQLHPGLKSHVSVNRHVYREEVWYVLQDTATGRQHRLNQHSYALVGRMNGRLSVQEIWEQVVQELGDSAPTQPEVITLVGKLHQAELIRTEVTPNVAELFRARDVRERKERTSKLNPFAFRVTLFDPDPVLEYLAPFAKYFLKSWAVVLWLIAVAGALGLVATNWPELRQYGATHLTTPRMILVMWFVYPILKAVHELAHGLVLKSWGGESHDFGVTLMLLMPVPYIDCSSAAGFAEKHRRIAVSLVGIAVEVLVAAFACVIWLYASDGVIREIAFALMFIGGVSTIIFNANPLMKFDGYHALADAVEIPGLAARSQQMIDFKLKTKLLGATELVEVAHLPEERPWLFGYGVCAFVYKFVVTIGIVSWLLGVSVALALAASAWFVIAMLVLPLAKLAWFAWSSPQVRRARLRAVASVGFVVMALGYIMFGMPIPHVTAAQGVVWLPEDARVRARNDGFITRVLQRDGDRINVGDVIVEMEDPNLSNEQQKLQARLDGLQANYYAAMVKSPAQGALLAEDLGRLNAEIAALARRAEQLRILSTANGRLVLPQAQNLPGKFASKGSLIAHVIPDNKWQVRVVLAQQDVAQVRHATQSVFVRPLQSGAPQFVARLGSQAPSAVRELPSPALGDRAGGIFLTDPNDQQGVKTLDPVFVLDLAVPSQQLERLGERVHVRFDHGQSTLAQQWSHRAHQVFLKALGAERPLLAGA